MKFLLVHLSILVLAILSAKAESPTHPECGPGEEFKTCAPSQDRTCENVALYGNNLISFVETCFQRCSCLPGFARNATGSCIPDSSCPPIKCDDPNAQYSFCKDTCPVTCENRNTLLACTMDCQMPGNCRCNQGYVKGPDGLCILPESCPANSVNVCPTDPNAIVTNCGDPCPTTCENKNDSRPRPCPRICLKNGCKCKEGFVKGPEGRCILPSSCPDKVRNAFGVNHSTI